MRAGNMKFTCTLRYVKNLSSPKDREQAKKRARERALFNDSNSSKNDAGSTADLAQKVSRQLEHKLLFVSLDTVVGDFQYLLHGVPRVGLTRKPNFTA